MVLSLYISIGFLIYQIGYKPIVFNFIRESLKNIYVFCYYFDSINAMPFFNPSDFATIFIFPHLPSTDLTISIALP